MPTLAGQLDVTGVYAELTVSYLEDGRLEDALRVARLVAERVKDARVLALRAMERETGKPMSIGPVRKR